VLPAASSDKADMKISMLDKASQLAAEQLYTLDVGNPSVLWEE